MFSEGDLINIQFIGFEKRIIKISSKELSSNFKLGLKPKDQSLEEVILSVARNPSKRKQIAEKVQFEWDQNFDEPIEFVIGNEWNAGNLSYHLKSRPKWEGFMLGNNILNEAKEYICIDEICVGTYK